jgi:triacylglycerol lipase
MTVCALLQFLIPAPVHAAVAARPARPPEGENGGRRVVLVHGIYDSPRSMQWMKHLLEGRGWLVSTISLKPNDGSIPFDAMARQVDAFVAATIPAGEKFDIVAFSMGGLVSRYYIQKLGGYERVRRLVTISTPNHGTIWAWMSGQAGVKQMRPGSEMLRELNGDVSKMGNYTSIYTPFDLTIVPPPVPTCRGPATWWSGCRFTR